jgi:ornithine cyclodeaminase
VVVEYEPQSRIEGEIQQLPGEFAVTELAQVVSGKQPGRARADEVTIFDSVGFALEDFGALRYLHELNRAERGSRPQVDLVPQLADPKNLYSLLAAGTRRVTALEAVSA